MPPSLETPRSQLLLNGLLLTCEAGFAAAFCSREAVARTPGGWSIDRHIHYYGYEMLHSWYCFFIDIGKARFD